MAPMLAKLLIFCFFGLVQGLTEFLPISSSGHLTLAQFIVGPIQNSVPYFAFLHLATLLAVILVLWKEIVALFKNKEFKIFGLLMVASLPAALVGYFLSDLVEQSFHSLTLVSLGFLFTGLLLAFLPLKVGPKRIKELNFISALKIGLLQALAVFPGISRSAMTILGGFWQKLEPKDNFQFSYLLSIPIIFGAYLFELKKIEVYHLELGWLLGFGVAFISGFLSLKVLKKFFESQKLKFFKFFGFYLIVLTLICLSFLLLSPLLKGRFLL